ncbi:MAG: hypothetical protein D6826_03200 [Alphaproteobacteria bacterium]|nr:MAG: hypothetical protein D6826_03200 [Alphaproteobacteria bacterium]
MWIVLVVAGVSIAPVAARDVRADPSSTAPAATEPVKSAASSWIDRFILRWPHSDAAIIEAAGTPAPPVPNVSAGGERSARHVIPGSQEAAVPRVWSPALSREGSHSLSEALRDIAWRRATAARLRALPRPWPGL